MFKSFINDIKNIEKNILKIMISEIKIFMTFCITGVVFLLYYIFKSNILIAYEAGTILFKTGLMLATFCFMCSFVFDKMVKK